ncbi:MAG TPA: helix-turn-helix domain-containing protein [Jatrophihabitans sp.]|jgi:hypothetical protein
MSISLRQLLTLGHLPGHSVLAGASGLSAPVHAVVPGTTVRALKEPAEGRLVVFAAGQLPLDDPNADLAIRFCASSGIVGLITTPPKHPVALSTLRLADKYGIALITAGSVDQAATVTALEADVRAPEVTGAHRLTAVVRQLSPHSSDAPQVIAVLRSELRLPLALLDSEGHRVEGDESVDWEQLTSRLKDVLDSSHPTERVHDAPDGAQLILHPVVLPTSQRAGLWFAAVVEADNSAMVDPVRHCLAIGAWGFTAHLATRSLMTEVEGRQRALLLGEILDNAESPSRQTVERATVLGWRLSGWHTVVHLATAGGTLSVAPAGFAADLEAALAAAGIVAPVVERPDGWMLWVTEEIALDSADQERLARIVRQALLSIESEHDGLRMCAGVGLPAQGSIGLGNSLREARKASLLARANQTMAAVERTDPIGLKRMLLGWYSYGPARDIAAEVLEPLRAADPTGELNRTLGCFLDYESSIATTAAVLGVHRNTVLHRLTKIRTLLGVDLSDPNDRLAAHLATRAEQLPQEPEPDHT